MKLVEYIFCIVDISILIHTFLTFHFVAYLVILIFLSRYSWLLWMIVKGMTSNIDWSFIYFFTLQSKIAAMESHEAEIGALKVACEGLDGKFAQETQPVMEQVQIFITKWEALKTRYDFLRMSVFLLYDFLFSTIMAL